jgi:hypothetical protein
VPQHERVVVAVELILALAVLAVLAAAALVLRT